MNDSTSHLSLAASHAFAFASLLHDTAQPLVAANRVRQPSNQDVEHQQHFDIQGETHESMKHQPLYKSRQALAVDGSISQKEALCI